MSTRLKTEDNDYRAYVGPLDRYDFMGASQFRLLTGLGLRAEHKLLDFGCGSLRSGKLLIPYLNAGNYYGQEPNKWLIDEGLKNELGEAILLVKKPRFSNQDDFPIGFDEKFDFIIAQSIFSHTDLTLTKRGLASIYDALSEDGLALVTIIEGADYTGDEAWVYPGATSFTPRTIKKTFQQIGCHWRRLYWFHPAQSWFVMSKNRDKLPSAKDAFFLLGGEEVNSSQYKRQQFLSNRLFSAQKGSTIFRKLAFRFLRK